MQLLTKASSAKPTQRSLATRFPSNVFEGRWSEVSLWSAIRITVFPTTAVMARTVLITKKLMICLSKPCVSSFEQYDLAAACRVCIFLLTQNLKYVQGWHFFLATVLCLPNRNIGYQLACLLNTQVWAWIYCSHPFTVTKCSSFNLVNNIQYLFSCRIFNQGAHIISRRDLNYS